MIRCNIIYIERNILFYNYPMEMHKTTARQKLGCIPNVEFSPLKTSSSQSSVLRHGIFLHVSRLFVLSNRILNFHSLEVVSRCRDPQPKVVVNCARVYFLQADVKMRDFFS